MGEQLRFGDSFERVHEGDLLLVERLTDYNIKLVNESGFYAEFPPEDTLIEISPRAVTISFCLPQDNGSIHHEDGCMYYYGQGLLGMVKHKCYLRKFQGGDILRILKLP